MHILYSVVPQLELLSSHEDCLPAMPCRAVLCSLCVFIHVVWCAVVSLCPLSLTLAPWTVVTASLQLLLTYVGQSSSKMSMDSPHCHEPV